MSDFRDKHEIILLIKYNSIIPDSQPISSIKGCFKFFDFGQNWIFCKLFNPIKQK